MRAQKFYESLLVVEGRGDFPLDMLRYDVCFPYDASDSNRIERTAERLRIVLRRRSVNGGYPTTPRWESFSWKVLLTTDDPYEARQLADEPL